MSSVVWCGEEPSLIHTTSMPNSPVWCMMDSRQGRRWLEGASRLQIRSETQRVAGRLVSGRMDA